MLRLCIASGVGNLTEQPIAPLLGSNLVLNRRDKIFSPPGMSECRNMRLRAIYKVRPSSHADIAESCLFLRRYTHRFILHEMDLWVTQFILHKSPRKNADVDMSRFVSNTTMILGTHGKNCQTLP